MGMLCTVRPETSDALHVGPHVYVDISPHRFILIHSFISPRFQRQADSSSTPSLFGWTFYRGCTVVAGFCERKHTAVGGTVADDYCSNYTWYRPEHTRVRALYHYCIYCAL